MYGRMEGGVAGYLLGGWSSGDAFFDGVDAGLKVITSLLIWSKIKYILSE